MTPKSPSLTAYDFLGYIVPGLMLVALIDASIYYHIEDGNVSYTLLHDRYFNIKIAGIIPILLFSYLVGHILGFISAVLIERHATWLHGTPTQFLLSNTKPLDYFKTAGASPKTSFFLRLCTALIILPITIIDFIFTKHIPISANYIKALDPLLISASAEVHASILKKLDIKKIGKDDWSSADIHRLTIHCSLESAPAHVSSLRNYVVLYGFLRSVTLIAVVIFWVALFHLNGMVVWWKVIVASLVSGFFAFICYAAYLKFWIRYHREGIMAMIASYVNSKQ